MSSALLLRSVPNSQGTWFIIKMIQNIKIVRTLPKLQRHMFSSASNNFPSFFENKRRCSSPRKISYLKKVNGFLVSVSLNQKLPELESSVRSFSQISGDKCWKCQKPLEVKEFHCVSCGTLQYPKENINYFQLLNISQSYDIDLEELSQKFKSLQMIFHPDKFATKSKEELEISEMHSRLINKAYKTLKNPLGRGYYLLDLQNVPSDIYPLQQEFLMTIMEKNEELESLDSPSDIEKFKKKNNEEIYNLMDLIKEAFRTNHLQKAKTNLLKLNYYINLDNKIKEKHGPNDLSPKIS